MEADARAPRQKPSNSNMLQWYVFVDGLFWVAVKREFFSGGRRKSAAGPLDDGPAAAPIAPAR